MVNSKYKVKKPKQLKENEPREEGGGRPATGQASIRKPPAASVTAGNQLRMFPMNDR